MLISQSKAEMLKYSRATGTWNENYESIQFTMLI